MEDLLFLAHRIPYPPNKGDKIRSFHILRWLASRYRVHLGAFVDDPADFAHADTLRAYCASMQLRPLSPLHARLRSLSGLLTGDPLTNGYYRDRSLAAWTDSTIAKHDIRRAFVFSSGMARYVADQTGMHRVMDFVDVDSDKWRQYGESLGGWRGLVYRREARTLLAFEQRIATEFDASVLVSDAEAALFVRLVPIANGKIHALENGVDADYFSPDREYPNPYPSGVRALVFTGAMDYHANVDAVAWFVREVFPGVRAAVADAHFYIVGGRPADAVRALATEQGVTVTAAVPDVRPYLQHAHAAVAPLRVARGVQNKVLEAMAMARRVVVSPQAAEGIHEFDGLTRDLACDATTFSERCIALLRTHTVPAIENREFVHMHYNWERNLSRLEHLFDKPFQEPQSTSVMPLRRAKAAS